MATIRQKLNGGYGLPGFDAPVSTGTQPAQIALSPDGAWAYVVNEVAATVSMYSVNATTGALTSTKFFVQDHQGSVIGISRWCCNDAWKKAAYDDYGQLVTGAIGDQPFGYTGRRYDAETEIYFDRARDYGPAWGR